MIVAHVSLENMEKQWKLITRQMIKTFQLLPSLPWKPAVPTPLLSGHESELNNVNIYTSYQSVIQAATQLLNKEPSFDRILVSSKHIKRSLLPFLGNALSWLNGTATPKDVNAIKTRIKHLMHPELLHFRQPYIYSDYNQHAVPHHSIFTYHHAMDHMATL